MFIGPMDLLRAWPPEALAGLAAILNAEGRVSEEALPGLSANLLAAWNDACEDLLRVHGYRGGALAISRGRPVMLFDSARGKPAGR